MLKSKKLFGKYKLGETLIAYAFLAPALIFILTFVLGPILASFSYAFTDYYLLRPNDIQFIGLENFKYLIEDKLMWKAFFNTFQFIIMVIPLQVGTALILALLVNRKIKFNLFFKVSFFAPVVMSLVVISILWMTLLNPESGLINAALTTLGLSKQPFLTSTTQVMPTIVAVSAWQGAGYQTMIFLAGLKNIPAEYYEAASLDGANGWQKFLYITLPSLKNVTVFIMITTLIAAFKLIVQPMVMTSGGPKNSSLTIVYYIYQTGVRYRNVGYASAITLVFAIIVAILILLQRRLIKEED
ncbi:MAG: binding-protein-dependent transport system inner rane component [Defluviitaleaceae bacterium]|nr:binding-protein-dependent transport system inner rane component [Defluviitaleaceae bacterium]